MQFSQTVSHQTLGPDQVRSAENHLVPADSVQMRKERYDKFFVFNPEKKSNRP